MRTTLTLDDDVADKLKSLSRKRRLPFRQVLNDVLRQGLSGRPSPSRPPKSYQLRTFRSAFKPGVDPMKLNQLLDDLEAGDAVERIGR
jgi:hypothetical protein